MDASLLGLHGEKNAPEGFFHLVRIIPVPS